ncbi:MAG TPA: hypothetical protein VKE22_19100 [Haliangiales bacterium]|nr:hypothetical protein [Haliangiales bacterium]
MILTVCALDAEPLVATERRAAIALYDVWAPAAAALAARLGAETRVAVSRRAAELHALPGAVVVPDVAGDAVALAGAATGADRVVRVTELCPEPVVTIAGEIDRPGVRVVPAGIAIEDLVEAHGPRPVAWVALGGGPLGGAPLDRDARVGREVRALYVGAAGSELVRRARAAADARRHALSPSGLGGEPVDLPLDLVALRLGLVAADPPWITVAP